MRNILLTNIRLKLLALAFATALWFFVAGQSNTEVGFLVPIGFKGIPKDLVIAGTPPSEIEVRVVGPKLFINNLSPSQITPELDLSAAKEGLNTYRLQSKDIAAPIGVEVLRIRPSSVDIRMERLMNVVLPVRVKLNGRPAEGFRITDVSVSPKTINASGLKRDIRDLDSIYTKPVDINGLSFTTSLNAQLDIPPHEFRTISGDTVTVRVRIERER